MENAIFVFDEGPHNGTVYNHSTLITSEAARRRKSYWIYASSPWELLLLMRGFLSEYPRKWEPSFLGAGGILGRVSMTHYNVLGKKA